MPRKKLDTIDFEEFERRLDANNERKHLELDRREAKLDQVEQLLSHYEAALDEIETDVRSKENVPAYPHSLRQRLQELATKTTEIAASL